MRWATADFGVLFTDSFAGDGDGTASGAQCGDGAKDFDVGNFLLDLGRPGLRFSYKI